MSFILRYFLIILFLLSPTYVTSMRSGDDSFTGLLVDYLTLPSFVWPIILLFGLLFVCLIPRLRTKHMFLVTITAFGLFTFPIQNIFWYIGFSPPWHNLDHYYAIGL